MRLLVTIALLVCVRNATDSGLRGGVHSQVLILLAVLNEKGGSQGAFFFALLAVVLVSGSVCLRAVCCLPGLWNGCCIIGRGHLCHGGCGCVARSCFACFLAVQSRV